ncbi:MAG: hypothetical protein R3A47_09495 [Polyangiales bacterium]
MSYAYLRSIAFAALFFLFVLSVACADPGAKINFQIGFSPESVSSSVAAIEVFLVNDCDDVSLGTPPNDYVRSIVARRNAPVEGLGALNQGNYGAYGIATTDDCEIVATGCRAFAVGNENATVSLVLSELDDGATCSEASQCDRGVCSGGSAGNGGTAGTGGAAGNGGAGGTGGAAGGVDEPILTATIFQDNDGDDIVDTPGDDAMEGACFDNATVGPNPLLRIDDLDDRGDATESYLANGRLVHRVEWYFAAEDGDANPDTLYRDNDLYTAYTATIGPVFPLNEIFPGYPYNDCGGSGEPLCSENAFNFEAGMSYDIIARVYVDDETATGEEFVDVRATFNVAESACP